MKSLKQVAKQSYQSAQTIYERARQQHLTLAVTGLSRSGKTAFITSLVNQLMQGNAAEQLPLFDLVRERRLESVRQVEQPHFEVASFRYLSGLKRLAETPPQWPVATRNLSEIRLQLNYRSKEQSWLPGGEERKLLLDIVDYPGEWLLDLPMLRQEFQQWSEQQWHLLEQEPRAALSQSWQQKVIALSGQEPDDEALHQLAHDYGELLKQFKYEHGLTQLQPGRMLMPGELEGTPALAFFPLPQQKLLEGEEGEALWRILEGRFNYYVKHVVGAFYRNYFSRFDRQIVLVDCLTPLNQGAAQFQEMQNALASVMESFSYGQQNWLKQLFQPKIERVLIAATKADHVTQEQFSNLSSLLKELVQGGLRYVSGYDIKTESQALAAIRSTRFGHVQQGKARVPALKGNRLEDGQTLTLFPGEVPAKLPDDAYFSQHGFNFLEFAPEPRHSEFSPLPHIGMDKALQYLLEDLVR